MILSDSLELLCYNILLLCVCLSVGGEYYLLTLDKLLSLNKKY